MLLVCTALVALGGCSEDPAGGAGGSGSGGSVEAATVVSYLGRVWQHSPASGPFTYNQANRYCEALELADRDDWRLPRVEELRSLIVDCPERQLGGACEVAEECLDKDCYDMAQCGHCAEKEGPSDGCYWQPDMWGGSCTTQWFTWTSSPFNGLTDHFWVVRFNGGGLFDDGVVGFNEELGDGDVRCITSHEGVALEQPEAPPPGGISTTEFCQKAIAACDSVDMDQCMAIVADADKRVRPDDIPCAAASQSCEDTATCLDELQVRNLSGEYVEPAAEPTTQPIAP